MTEEEAQSAVEHEFGRSAVDRLAAFAELLRTEAAQQNLVSAASLTALWGRHLLDSGQLLLHAPATVGMWIDIGTGAGLPGIVIALLRDGPITLVEPRRLRAAFLERAVDQLQLAGRATVVAQKSENLQLPEAAAVISARAVAALPKLLRSSLHLSDPRTVWLLPKGRSAQSEVAAAHSSWHGSFHVKPSLTDPAAGIVMASGVLAR